MKHLDAIDNYERISERRMGAHVADVLGDLDSVRVQLLANFLVQAVCRRNLYYLHIWHTINEV